MRLLLDTNAFLFAALDPRRLSRRARDVLSNSSNERLLSSVVSWELAIKIAAGKLSFATSLDDFLARQIASLELTELPITRPHALATIDLPPIHQDPFDRILVAQAIVEDAVIVTADAIIGRYPAPTIW